MNKRFPKQLFILIYFFLPPGLLSQEFPFRKYDITDGLPQTQVMGIYQDRPGFIWLMTKNGLSRFDGMEFMNFYPSDGIPDNRIISMTEDEEGNVWLLSRSGITRYDGTAFRFYPPPDQGEFPSFSSSIIYRQGKLWTIVQKDGTGNLVSFDDGTYQNESSALPALDSLDIHRLTGRRTSAELLLVTVGNRVYEWKDGNLSPLSAEPFNNIWAQEDVIYDFGKDGFRSLDDQGWQEIRPVSLKDEIIDPVHVGIHDGKLRLTGNKFISDIAWDHEWCNGFLTDRDSTLWIIAEDGLYRLYSPAFLYFTEKDGLNGNIWSVVADDRHNIWFASFLNGLQKYDGERFHNMDQIFTIKKQPLYMGSRKLSNGDILFATGTGVIRWDGSAFRNVDWVNGQTEYIYEDPTAGAILVGSVTGLFYHKYGVTRKFSEFSPEAHGHVMGIAKDLDGIYWLVTEKTVARFDGERALFFDPAEVPLKSGASADADSLGNVWLGGAEGLFVHRREGGFTPVMPDQFSQPVKFVKVMDRDRVLAGRMNDLVIIDIRKYAEGSQDYFTILNKDDGFLGLECRQNGVLKDSQGKYWINTTNSVVRFDLERLRKNSRPPVLMTLRVDILDDSLRWIAKYLVNNHRPSQNREIQLGHREKNIRIHYTGISTGNPEGVRYRFRLAGRQEEWSPVISDRFVEFQNLRPGRYAFEIIAASRGGLWTSSPARLEFSIKPAIWQTWFFKALMVIVTATLIILLTYRIFHLRNRIREEKRLTVQHYTRLQVNQVIGQFDPHFTINAVAAIGSLLLKEENEKAYEYLVKFSKLLRSVLQEHDIFTKELGEEIEFISDYCEIQQLRLGDRFRYSIKVDEEVDLKTKVPKMIIHSFVENAIKHGLDNKPGGGTVEIGVIQEASDIIISITDDGIGREAAGKFRNNGTGKGQQLTRELFTLINKLITEEIRYEVKDLYDDMGQAAGTAVKIVIPSDPHYLN